MARPKHRPRGHHVAHQNVAPSCLACATTRARLWLAAWVQSYPTSHFSAVLDQHCPQAVTFSLYECSTANSRREFQTKTRKSSSESDDEDALRCARGSSER